MQPRTQAVAIGVLLLGVVVAWTSVGSDTAEVHDETSNGGEFTGWRPTQQELDELAFPPGPVPPEFWDEDVNWTEVSKRNAPPAIPEHPTSVPDGDPGSLESAKPCSESCG